MRMTASPISRMLPGSLAKRHDAHQRPGQGHRVTTSVYLACGPRGVYVPANRMDPTVGKGEEQRATVWSYPPQSTKLILLPA